MPPQYRLEFGALTAVSLRLSIMIVLNHQFLEELQQRLYLPNTLNRISSFVLLIMDMIVEMMFA